MRKNGFYVDSSRNKGLESATDEIVANSCSVIDSLKFNTDREVICLPWAGPLGGKWKKNLFQSAEGTESKET